MSKTITDYTAAVSINATTDYLLIEQSGVYKKINRNVLLALASAPLGTTDTQSPTNKTFDNTNAYTIKDGSLTLQNTASATKQAVFSLASITAGQTRTITLPDASLTVVGTATTQTLTNKTLTSPTISGGTIDNSTITVDSISGHTSATIVTVANLQISNGVLNSNASVVPNNLVAATGSSWAWLGFVPTWVNLSPGNGTVTAGYTQIGKVVEFYIYLIFGSGTTISGSVTATVPVTADTVNGVGDSIGLVKMYDSSATTAYMGEADLTSTTVVTLRVNNTSSTYSTQNNLSSTVPFTWATSDELHIRGKYNVA